MVATPVRQAIPIKFVFSLNIVLKLSKRESSRSFSCVSRGIHPESRSFAAIICYLNPLTKTIFTPILIELIFFAFRFFHFSKL